MDTPEEMERDEWLAAMQETISQVAMDEHKFELLKTYYVNNPGLVGGANDMFVEGMNALSASPTAAVVLFAASIEVCLKKTIVKPIVYGWVHNESVAELISGMVMRNSIPDLRKTINSIVKEYGGIDLETYRIEPQGKPVWDRIKEVFDLRNHIVHQGKVADTAQAATAMLVCSFVLGVFLTSVLKHFGLKLGDKMIVSTLMDTLESHP